MDMPSNDTPAEAYLPRSAYTVSRVAAVKKTKGLEQPLTACHGALKKCLRDRDDLEEIIEQKAAILDACDDDCDTDIEAFELSLLALVDKQRGDKRYARYFPNGLRAVTTAEPRVAEPEQVDAILKAMEEDKNDPDLGPLAAVHAPKIAASRKAVLAAAADLGAAEKDLAYLDDKTLAALLATWREEYKKLEGALLTVYPSSPKRVDRFFKAFRKRDRRVKKPAPAPVVTTTP